MPVSNMTLWMSTQVNGREEKLQGRLTFENAIRHLVIWGRAEQTSGFSTAIIKLSTREIVAHTDALQKEFDAATQQLIEMVGAENITQMTPEEQAEADHYFALQKDPAWIHFTKMAMPRNRDTMSGVEWASLLAQAKAKWPEEVTRMRL